MVLPPQSKDKSLFGLMDECRFFCWLCGWIEDVVRREYLMRRESEKPPIFESSTRCHSQQQTGVNFRDALQRRYSMIW